MTVRKMKKKKWFFSYLELVLNIFVLMIERIYPDPDRIGIL